MTTIQRNARASAAAALIPPCAHPMSSSSSATHSPSPSCDGIQPAINTDERRFCRGMFTMTCSILVHRSVCLLF